MTQNTSDALTMSLDEIIVQQKATKRAARDERKKKPSRAAPYTTNGSSKPRGASSIASAADKLVVSNLAASVSQQDVRELFQRIGPIKNATLNYNQSGKSTGVANVLFSKAGDAHKAYKEYNNRPLDNKPMKIELIINPESANLKPLESRLGGSSGVGKSKNRKEGREPRGRFRGKNNEAKGPKKDVTVMDLDAEMDAYMATDASASVSLATALE